MIVRSLSRIIFRMSIFINSSLLEREVRLKLEDLLPRVFNVEKASKYTESTEEYKGAERLPVIPVDYFIMWKNGKIAAIEVTSGQRGYTVHNSRFLKITHKKVEALEREKIPGFVIVVVIGEPDKSSKERYIWCRAEDILMYEPVHEQVPPYGEWEWNHHVPIKEWNIGLQDLVKELLKTTEHAKQTRF